MKHVGRKLLLSAVGIALAGSGIALLGSGTVGPSYASSKTMVIPPKLVAPVPLTNQVPLANTANPANCSQSVSLTFAATGKDSSGPASGVNCGAASAGQLLVMASTISGDQTSCTSIAFEGTSSSDVNVPLSRALQAHGADVKLLSALETFRGTAKLTGCSGAADVSVNITLSVT